MTLNINDFQHYIKSYLYAVGLCRTTSVYSNSKNNDLVRPIGISLLAKHFNIILFYYSVGSIVVHFEVVKSEDELGFMRQDTGSCSNAEHYNVFEVITLLRDEKLSMSSISLD